MTQLCLIICEVCVKLILYLLNAELPLLIIARAVRFGYVNNSVSNAMSFHQQIDDWRENYRNNICIKTAVTSALWVTRHVQYYLTSCTMTTSILRRVN